MAVELREYIGDCPSAKSATIGNKKGTKANLTEGYNVIDPIAKDSIMQDIEGIHVGPTRNFTWYTDEALISSVTTWTQPYQKPLIMHHNETDGKIIGRVVHAQHVTQNTRSGTPALVFTCNVPDKEGKEQIQDGRLKTVSIGVIAHDITCSICGQQIEVDEDGVSTCGHLRGAVYNTSEGEKVCYWMVHKMEAKELSYVIVPSDIYAHNIRTYKPTQKQILDSQESFNQNKNVNLNEGVNNIMNDQNNMVKGTNVNEATKINEVNGQATNANEDDVTTNQPVNQPQEDPQVKEDDKKAQEPETDLAKENESLKAELQASKEKIAEVQKSVIALQKELEKLNNTVKEETELRKNAENELLTAQVEARDAIEDSLNSLRVIANKESIAKDQLAIRTKESLLDSIKDLKEELSNNTKKVNIAEANDPTLKKNLDLNENVQKQCVKTNTVNSNNLNEAAVSLDDVFKSFGVN